MKATTKLAAVGAAAALLAVPAVSQGDHRDRGWDRGGRDLDVVGLTADGRLISFESDSPDRAKTEGKIRGLVTDTKIVGLDYRPARATTATTAISTVSAIAAASTRSTTTAGRPHCARA